VISATKINPVVDRLNSVLDQGDIPAPYDRWGARLLAHLTKPVQVVVTGLAGSGKSALIEMMSAQPVIGQSPSMPVTELAYGHSLRALYERADGSVTEMAGFLKDCIPPEDAIRARQELPDTGLIGQSYVEIGLRGSLSHMQMTLEAACARADIVIWCSQEFNEEEQQLWFNVPDHLKDHSMLVLTMADRQLMRGVLPETIARLSPIVADEFLGLYPVATIQGITAQTSGETINQSLWASCGGRPLVDLVQKQVKQGRSADIDRARVFMDRLALRANQFVQADDLSSPTALAPIEPQQAKTPDLGADAQTLELLSEAVDLLQQQAGIMLDTVDSSDDLDPDAILEGCTEAFASLAELLEIPSADDPAACAMREDVQEGEEMLMLFQLERGEDAALDAVTLLLQMRKELIDKVAG